jgi:hypothetical protein
MSTATEKPMSDVIGGILQHTLRGLHQALSREVPGRWGQEHFARHVLSAAHETLTARGLPPKDATRLMLETLRDRVERLDADAARELGAVIAKLP